MYAYSSDRGDGQGGGAQQHQLPLLPQDAGRDRQHEQRDAGRQQQRQGVIAEGHPEADGRGQQPASGVRPGAALAGCPSRCSSTSSSADEEQVQAVRIGADRVLPRDGRHGQQRAGDHADGGSPRDLDDGDGDEGAGAGHEDRRQQVGPQRGVTERLQHHGRQPQQQHVAGIARWDGRCPAPGRAPGTRPCPRSPGRASGCGCRAASSPRTRCAAGHQPVGQPATRGPGSGRRGRVPGAWSGLTTASATPHVTPQRLMTTDAMTSSGATTRPRRHRPTSTMPSVTRIIANGAKSLLNR